MLALQASIGALNDLVDAGVDSGRKPGKPIPRGAARPADAWTIAALGLALGLALSAVSGPLTVAVAAAGVGCGYLYDLRLSRTPWSWLPLALALPLLPIHAWVGSTGSAPPALVALVPVALLAGAGLALGNGLVDVERDRAARLRTAVVVVGPRPARWAHAGALAAAVLGAVLLAPRAPWPWWPTGAVVAAVLIAAGVALVATARPGLRERGWELEAIGIAVLGVTWLAGVAAG